MKTLIKSVRVIHWGQLSTVIAASLLFAGCSSTGYDKSDAAAKSLRSAASEVQAQGRALDMTMTALNELVNKPSPDLKPQFQSFSASLDRLIDSAERTQRTGQRVQKKNAEYFEAWDRELAQMNYEYVRKSSEARKTEVTTQLATISQRYTETGEVVGPLVAYLEDIRKALRSDLTPGGLVAVKNVVANAQENASKVQIVLSQLAADLSVSGDRMSSVAFQTSEQPPAEQREANSPGQ